MTTLIAVEHAEGDRRRKEAELAKKAKEINYYGPRRVRDEARLPTAHFFFLLFLFFSCFDLSSHSDPGEEAREPVRRGGCAAAFSPGVRSVLGAAHYAARVRFHERGHGSAAQQAGVEKIDVTVFDRTLTHFFFFFSSL